jgi:hypothetical protein
LLVQNETRWQIELRNLANGQRLSDGEPAMNSIMAVAMTANEVGAQRKKRQLFAPPSAVSKRR